jgi:sugar/nucleoside kinase (ribokinase family)
MFQEEGIFSAPGLPLESVYDPTGAGDCFAGGFMGYLASHAGDVTDAGLRQAVILGSVMASFAVEAFSLERIRSLQHREIQKRFEEFKRLTHFDDSLEGMVERWEKS